MENSISEIINSIQSGVNYLASLIPVILVCLAKGKMMEKAGEEMGKGIVPVISDYNINRIAKGKNAGFGAGLVISIIYTIIASINIVLFIVAAVNGTALNLDHAPLLDVDLAMVGIIILILTVICIVLIVVIIILKVKMEGPFIEKFGFDKNLAIAMNLIPMVAVVVGCIGGFDKTHQYKENVEKE